MRQVLSTVLVVILCGCSTLTQGVNQDVALVTPGVEGAACTVKAHDGRQLAATTTPGSVRLSKSRRDVQAVCEKPGYLTGTTTVPASLAGRSLIQAPVGYVVDGVSGAMWTYPSQVVIRMPAADGG